MGAGAATEGPRILITDRMIGIFFRGLFAAQIVSLNMIKTETPSIITAIALLLIEQR